MIIYFLVVINIWGRLYTLVTEHDVWLYDGAVVVPALRCVALRCALFSPALFNVGCVAGLEKVELPTEERTRLCVRSMPRDYIRSVYKVRHICVSQCQVARVVVYRGYSSP
jgi:hypothetical protein